MTLFDNIADIAPIGDDLDRCYTPIPLADLCVERVAALMFAPSVIVEPSVGGGNFARAARRQWPRALLIGCDVDPDAAGFALCDTQEHVSWPVLAPSIRCAQGVRTLVIGNPPFSGDTAIDHVLAARSVPNAAVALILPWGFLGGVDRWGFLAGEHRPDLVMPITPRPWGDRVRETALYVWLVGDRPASTQVVEPIRWRK